MLNATRAIPVKNYLNETEQYGNLFLFSVDGISKHQTLLSSGSFTIFFPTGGFIGIVSTHNEGFRGLKIRDVPPLHDIGIVPTHNEGFRGLKISDVPPLHEDLYWNGHEMNKKYSLLYWSVVYLFQLVKTSNELVD